MCNAHNHSPNCQCGWGGVWYGGYSDSADWLFNSAPYERRLGLQQGTRSVLSGSFTVPNSSCPVCGANVYFYKSHYGGRVFFDALGPPWPKHPCTSSERVASPRAEASSWHESAWHALSNVSIAKSQCSVSFYQLNGITNFKNIQLTFRASEIVMAEIVRVRRLGKGKFEVSILDYDAAKLEWATWSGIAFADESMAIEVGHDLQRAVIHVHQQVAAGTAPNLAAVRSNTRQPMPMFVSCPECKVNVKQSNMPRHLRVVHGLDSATIARAGAGGAT